MNSTSNEASATIPKGQQIPPFPSPRDTHAFVKGSDICALCGRTEASALMVFCDGGNIQPPD